MPHWIRRIPIKPKDQAGLLKLAKPILFMESLQPTPLGSTQTYSWRPGDHLNHPEDIQKALSCTNTQEIRWISLPINLPYLAASTLNVLEEFLQLFIQDQRPYSSSRQLRDISGRLLDRGYIQKLSRYKIIQDSLLKAQIKLMASSHGAIKAFSAGQRVLSQQDNFQPNQGHAIVHCLDQKSDIPKVRKMSTSVGQNTLIRSKDKPEQAIVQVKAKVSPILDKSFHKSSTTCMMHLSLSKSVITGLKEPRYIEEETPGTSLPTDQKEAQSTKQSKLLNKPKPVIIVSNQGIPDESHILTEVPRAEPVHESNQDPHHKWKPKTKQSVVQVPKSEGALESTLSTKKKHQP
ncbi:hypothetical protein F2Q70_00017067 [Brassica cretica]|uniref:Uncharacterized protein n=1 Tax=Brassica cretica TaxID=69181 RepID=A0A8S9HVI2_BRACR|nr:hypothetical protein F2Q70_00017067 [Brassica cretica]